MTPSASPASAVSSRSLADPTNDPEALGVLRSSHAARMSVKGAGYAIGGACIAWGVMGIAMNLNGRFTIAIVAGGISSAVGIGIVVKAWKAREAIEFREFGIAFRGLKGCALIRATDVRSASLHQGTHHATDGRRKVTTWIRIELISGGAFDIAEYQYSNFSEIQRRVRDIVPMT